MDKFSIVYELMGACRTLMTVMRDVRSNRKRATLLGLDRATASIKRARKLIYKEGGEKNSE